MKQDPIARIEREVVQEQTHRDGIPQIVVGTFLVIAMLSMLDGNSSIFPVFVPFIPLAIRALRKRFTYPRIGYAQIKESRRNRLLGIWLVLSILVAGLLAFFIFRGMPQTAKQPAQLHYLIMIAVAFMIIALSIAFVLKNKHTLVIWYAILIAVFILAILVFKPGRHTVHWIVLTFGAAHILYGSISLISFLRKYPVLQDE